MKRFILHVIPFLGICFISFSIVFSLADGSTDYYYIKFTSKKQKSLIVGSSRAAQGMIPKYIEASHTGDGLYNYAFTLHSAYGNAYYSSIDRKLDKQGKEGLFLVCVNPWTLSSTTINPEDSLNFRERGSFIDKTHFVNMKPNMEYLTESYEGMNINILLNKVRKGEYQTYFTHENGWLEVTIESDLISRENRTAKKIESYIEQLKEYSGMSKNRVYYLKKTIDLLKNHGRVFIVRLPISEAMLKIEEQLIPEFDAIIEDIAQDYKIEYINGMLLRHEYQYTDGHHLDIESAKAFSDYLRRRIYIEQDLN